MDKNLPQILKTVAYLLNQLGVEYNSNKGEFYT